MSPDPPAAHEPAAPDPARVLTFGHGTASQDELVDLLRDAQVAAVVDVRRFPGSRRHPHVARDQISQWLPGAGVAYRWEPRLGGRRRIAADDDGPGPVDTWWQVEAFRAYAAHTRSPQFADALGDLLGQARTEQVAVMCSETLWWRCHRRLVADVLVLAHGVPVEHLDHAGRRTAHRPAQGARAAPGSPWGPVVWDGPPAADAHGQ